MDDDDIDDDLDDNDESRDNNGTIARLEISGSGSVPQGVRAVSYTHLDVYKRQMSYSPSASLSTGFLWSLPDMSTMIAAPTIANP